jgi:hypothetical protein
VTGHWPVVLYGENIVCANPIIDREHRIICLDGGCVLKDDGQLNAFIMPDIRCTDASSFSFMSYDPFPEAEVLGLDRCPESIAAAKELAERLKLTNVSFTAGTPEELSPGFDTVVSLRTMHENCAVAEEESLSPEEYERACTEALKGYAGALARLLVPGGCLFTAERSDTEELIRAWQAALAEAGFTVDPESRKDLACSEAGVPSPLTLFIAVKRSFRSQ